jgi:putative FmdB family regulatory protein
MPTYEYACKFCGHRLEIYQPMTADALRRCPACGKNGLKRLISGGAGLIFKGSGFYETDYRRKPDSAKSDAAPATDKKPATPAADKKSSDTKPAPKPEAVKPSAAKSSKT